MKTLLCFLVAFFCASTFAGATGNPFQNLTTAGTVNDSDVWPVVQSPTSSPADMKYTALLYKNYVLGGLAGGAFSINNGSTVVFGAGGTVLYTAGIGYSVEAHSANLDTYSAITPGTGVAAALGDAVNGTGGFITYSGIGGVVEAHSSALDALAALSPPSTSGYILSCTSGGVYSWVPNSASTYTFSSGLQNSSGTVSVLYGTTAGTALQGNAIGSSVEAWSPVLDAMAAGTYTGSTSITTLGTLSAGAVPWSLVTGTPTSAAGYGIVNGSTIDAWGTKTPPSGTVVGTSDTQTLTGKSIAASEVNSGVLSISQIPTGTSSSTVAIGNDTRFPASVTGIRKGAGAGSTDTAASSSDIQALIGSSVYDAFNAASTAQSNAETYAANASNLSSGTVPFGRLPVGTTTTTVARGDTPAAAQAAAISAAETNAATIYIPLSGSTAITGDIGANSGSWVITESSGNTFQNGTIQALGGVLDQYGNALIDSSGQFHYSYGNGLMTDTTGKLYWSGYDYPNLPFLGNEGQMYAANGDQVMDYNAYATFQQVTSNFVFYGDLGSIILGGDGIGTGTASFANGHAFINSAGAASFYDGIVDQYSNPIVDSLSQLYYPGGGNGLLTDIAGQLYWSNYNYPGTPLTDDLGQLHYDDGGLMANYNQQLFADSAGVTLGDGGGGGSASFANGDFQIHDNGSFSSDNGQFSTDGGGNISLNNIYAGSVGGNLFFFQSVSGNPVVDAGTGVPTASFGNGSIYLRTDGAAGTTIYARSAGVWSPLYYSGSYSGTGSATTSFTVTIGATMANTTYKVNMTGTDANAATGFYVSAKTTTTFTVTYTAAVTGAVAFDWTVFP
jgi:hypothetical protein